MTTTNTEALGIVSYLGVLRQQIITLALALTTAPALIQLEAAEPGKLATPSGARVFYVTHSLMGYVPDLLSEITKTSGIKGHQVIGVQGLGGSRTLDHWNLPDSQNTAKAALSAGSVDVAVFSPIQFPDEGLENFIQLGITHNPSMRFLVQLSWGGGDIDNQDFPTGVWDRVDREKSPAALERLYQRNIKAGEAQADALNKKYGQGKRIITLIPTAQALIKLRSGIYEQQIPGIKRQEELFVDAAHPSVPLQVFNTYLHLAVLYGKNPNGLPIPGALKLPLQGAPVDGLNSSLQRIAWEAARSYEYAGVRPAKK